MAENNKTESSKNNFLFISYAHLNKNIVLDMLKLISEQGYAIWFDEEIRASMVWSDEIADAIIDCEAFMVFISKESVKSAFVRREIEFAVSKQKKIIPIYIGCEPDILPSGLALLLNNIQGVLLKKNIKECAKNVCGVLARENFPRSDAKAAAPEKHIKIKYILKPAAAFIILAIIAAFSIPRVKAHIENSGDYKIITAKNTFMPIETIDVSIANITEDMENCRTHVGIWKKDQSEQGFKRSLTASCLYKSRRITLSAPIYAGEYEIATINTSSDKTITKLPIRVKSALGTFSISVKDIEYVQNEKITVSVRGAPKSILGNRPFIGIYKIDDEQHLFPIQKERITGSDCEVTLKAPPHGKYEIGAFIYDFESGMPSGDSLAAKTEIRVLL